MNLFSLSWISFILLTFTTLSEEGWDLKNQPIIKLAKPGKRRGQNGGSVFKVKTCCFIFNRFKLPHPPNVKWMLQIPRQIFGFNSLKPA
jgi:hypothetical protein